MLQKRNKTLHQCKYKYFQIILVGSFIGLIGSHSYASDVGGPRIMSPSAQPSDYREEIFSPDPSY